MRVVYEAGPTGFGLARVLRHGFVFDEPGETWSQRHLAWLGRVRLAQPLTEVVFGEYLGHHETLLARRDRLDRLIAEQATPGPWRRPWAGCGACTGSTR